MIKKEIFFIHSPLGHLQVSLFNGLLYSLSKTKATARNLCSQVDRLAYSLSKTKAAARSPLSHSAKKIQNQLEGYFLKKTKGFSISLFERGTPFQKRVWRELQKIPYGKTITYKELAQKIGKPKGARAVGGACAKNPFLIVVPCHRAVAQNHLGGFALGIKAKQILLKGEGHLF